MYFGNFLAISSWKRVGPFIWTNLRLHHPRMLCAKFGWNWPCDSWEEDFYSSSIYFCYSVVISPWKRAVPFIRINMNPHHRRMLCAKFVWNWPSGSEEEDFSSPQYIFVISLWYPLKKGRGPSFEQTWIPITQGCLVLSSVEISQVVLKKKIFKVQQFMFAISLSSPLKKGRGPSFEQTWIPITQGCFEPSLVKIGPVVLKKKSKIGKVYRRTDRRTNRQTDDGRQAIRKGHLSFQLRWAKENDYNFDKTIIKHWFVCKLTANLADMYTKMLFSDIN